MKILSEIEKCQYCLKQGNKICGPCSQEIDNMVFYDPYCHLCKKEFFSGAFKGKATNTICHECFDILFLINFNYYKGRVPNYGKKSLKMIQEDFHSSYSRTLPLNEIELFIKETNVY